MFLLSKHSILSLSIHHFHTHTHTHTHAQYVTLFRSSRRLQIKRVLRTRLLEDRGKQQNNTRRDANFILLECCFNTSQLTCVTFEVLAEVQLRTPFFGDMMLSQWVVGLRIFWGPFLPEDDGSRFHRNVGFHYPMKKHDIPEGNPKQS